MAQRSNFAEEIYRLGMVALIVLCCLIITILAIRSTHAATFRITGDGGGSVYDKAGYWDVLKPHKIIVDGPCYSSCTMVLNNYPNVCITKKASFGFHPAYIRPLWIGPYIVNDKATTLMWNRIPADVQRLVPGGLKVNRGGFFVPKLYIIPASKMPKRYACKS